MASAWLPLSKPLKKVNLFEDSSDDDMDILFKTSLSNTAKPGEKKSEKVQRSLFSESSDEDQIFGAAKSSEVKVPKPVDS